MGSQQSSENNDESKMVDSNGQINNNIIIQEAKDTHYQTIIGEKMLYGMYVIIALEFIKIGICSYGAWKRQLKKQYSNKNTPNEIIP